MVRTDAPRRRRGGDDSGFSLIEVTISVAIIAVVMLGLGAVFVATAAGTDIQGARQVAARIATDGLDRAHALSGQAVVKGRDLTSVQNQWTSRPAGVSTLLSGLTYAYDSTVGSTSGRNAALPTKALASVVDGVTYQQSFFVAGCQLTTASACLPAVATGTVPMFDVVVSVAWPDRSCAGGTCTYELSTLLAANTTEPLFNNNLTAVAPVISLVDGITSQVMDLTEAVTGPKVAVTGGNGAVTLTSTGQPAGVTLDPNTGAFTGVLSAVTAATTVTVTAADRFGLFSSTTFTWTVNPLPALTAAALPLVSSLLAITPIDLASTLKLTGGTGVYTWTCTGLPALLKLDKNTGVLTGIVSALGVLPLSCTATDSRGKSATTTLSLGVLAPVAVTTPTASQTLTRNVAFSLAAKASGGSGVYTWAATNLPTGLTLNGTTGVVSGTPTTAGIWKPVFTVRDNANRSATSTVTWTVR